MSTKLTAIQTVINTVTVNMKLFLDCEFNGFGGELISMALVDENERYFYEVLPCINPTSWVLNNVIPILNKQAIDLKKFQNTLFNFLNHYETIHIVADWPEDFSLFLRSLILKQGICILQCYNGTLGERYKPSNRFKKPSPDLLRKKYICPTMMLLR
jgi:hypothetical protein